MLMTASDLSGATKKWDCHYRLSKQVSSEFFNEGDLEKERFKKEPSVSLENSCWKNNKHFFFNILCSIFKGSDEQKQAGEASKDSDTIFE